MLFVRKQLSIKRGLLARKEKQDLLFSLLINELFLIITFWFAFMQESKIFFIAAPILCMTTATLHWILSLYYDCCHFNILYDCCHFLTKTAVALLASMTSVTLQWLLSFYYNYCHFTMTSVTLLYHWIKLSSAVTAVTILLCQLSCILYIILYIVYYLIDLIINWYK